MAIYTGDGEAEKVLRVMRDQHPTHFTLEINSFSLLSNSSLESYDSGDFEAGVYKWKLRLYPNGNKSRKGEGHLSIYLVMSETNTLSPGWEVHVFFRLFVLDQLRDKYLTFQAADGQARRFRATRTQSVGFTRLITLKEFKDPNKGFLVNDNCVFGAEVFIHNETFPSRRECLSMKSVPVSCKHTWRIKKFSELVNEFHCSDSFIAADHKWKIKIYPKGNGLWKEKSLSLFLELKNSTMLLPSRGVYVEYKLRIMDR